MLQFFEVTSMRNSDWSKVILTPMIIDNGRIIGDCRNHCNLIDNKTEAREPAKATITSLPKRIKTFSGTNSKSL